MDIKEYIASGILELYVMGALAEKERQEVEQQLKLYPGLAKELEEIQNSLESYAMLNQVQPPASLKNKVMSSIAAPSLPKQPVISPDAGKATASPVKLLRYQYGLAACLVLFIISSAAALVFFNRWKQAQLELNNMALQQSTVIARYSRLKTSHDETLKYFQMLRSPNCLKLQLKGLAISPESYAVIHWDINHHHVFIDEVHLPLPEIDRQYQLWAIVDGKPVNAGVFETGNNTRTLHPQPMNRISQAQAFAVTLEPRGGSEVPTLDKMYLFCSTEI